MHKTNTNMHGIHPMPNGDQPKLWFHEVFKKYRLPYKQAEVDLIKKLNYKNKKAIVKLTCCD